ncbi:MAG: hypothetical protein WCG01_01985 [bacterium]
MSNQIKRALELAKKTGDRLIIFDGPESENAFVVMNLEQYEDIIEGGCGEDCDCGHDHEADFEDDFDLEDDYENDVASLTEEEMLDKINRDIALWKEVHGEENSQDNLDSNEEMPAGFDLKNDTEQAVRNNQQRSRWAIRNDVKEAAEEIIEEDRHYLEEIHF